MEYQDTQNYQDSTSNTHLANIFYKVYGWMTFALVITGLTAYLGAYTFSNIINSYFYIILPVAIIGQFAIIIALSFFMLRLNFITAIILFIVFSFLMGLLFTSIFQVYTFNSIVSTFFIAGAMFFIMALYGAYTKTDLTQWSRILQMALIGLIIALVVNIFLANRVLDFVISIVGVLVFSLLTALSVQQIKLLNEKLSADNESRDKISLLGALTLYLNFINLFLMLLRLTGSQRR